MEKETAFFTSIAGHSKLSHSAKISILKIFSVGKNQKIAILITSPLPYEIQTEIHSVM